MVAWGGHHLPLFGAGRNRASHTGRCMSNPALWWCACVGGGRVHRRKKVLTPHVPARPPQGLPQDPFWAGGHLFSTSFRILLVRFLHSPLPGILCGEGGVASGTVPPRPGVAIGREPFLACPPPPTCLSFSPTPSSCSKGPTFGEGRGLSTLSPPSPPAFIPPPPPLTPKFCWNLLAPSGVVTPA